MNEKREDFRIPKESEKLCFYITGLHKKFKISIIIWMETFKANQCLKFLSYSLTDKEYRLVLLATYCMLGWERNNILPDGI